MRPSLTVHIPQNKDVSYSLYAAGQKAEKSYLTKSESEYIFKFSGGTAVVLFYTLFFCLMQDKIYLAEPEKLQCAMPLAVSELFTD